MVDLGLVWTVVAMWAVLALAFRVSPPSGWDSGQPLDSVLMAGALGLVASRVAYLALNDPESLSSLRTALVIRGGVEFWPGVVVTLGALMLSTRRHQRRGVQVALAELAPFLLWGYAAYEATCVVREGCYGPRSPIGFIPQGLQARVFPIGLAVAIVVAGAGFAIRHLWSLAPHIKLLLALAVLASVRAVAAFWLPHIGEGPSFAQVQSAVVGAVTGTMAVASFLRTRLRRRRTAGEVKPLADTSLEPSRRPSEPMTSGTSGP